MIYDYVRSCYFVLLLFVGMAVIKDIKILAKYWIFLLFPLGIINELIGYQIPKLSYPTSSIYFVCNMIAYLQVLLVKACYKTKIGTLIATSIIAVSMGIMMHILQSKIPYMVLLIVVYLASMTLAIKKYRELVDPLYFTAIAITMLDSLFSLVSMSFSILSTENDLRRILQYSVYIYHILLLSVLLILYFYYKRYNYVTD